MKSNSVIIVFLISAFIVYSCSSNAESHLKNDEALTIDSSMIAIIPYQSNQDWLFKNAVASSINTSEIKEIDSILVSSINKYNAYQKKEMERIVKTQQKIKMSLHDYIIDIKNYKRQYVVVINKIGEKEVWINCFCDKAKENWKSEIVSVRDGGKCYFNLKVNLSTKQYFEFYVNGES